MITTTRSVVGVVSSGVKKSDDVIDFCANPSVPEGWEVFSHQHSEPWEFQADRLGLFRSKRQLYRERIIGHELCNEIHEKELPVIGANLLDYFLSHPKSVPLSCRINEFCGAHAVYFWGTIYRHLTKGQFGVRSFLWGDGPTAWVPGSRNLSYCTSLDHEFTALSPALILI